MIHQVMLGCLNLYLGSSSASDRKKSAQPRYASFPVWFKYRSSSRFTSWSAHLCASDNRWKNGSVWVQRESFALQSIKLCVVKSCVDKIPCVPSDEETH